MNKEYSKNIWISLDPNDTAYPKKFIGIHFNKNEKNEIYLTILHAYGFLDFIHSFQDIKSFFNNIFVNLLKKNNYITYTIYTIPINDVQNIIDSLQEKFVLYYLIQMCEYNMQVFYNFYIHKYL